MGATQGRDKGGKLTKGDGSLSRQVFARLTPAQHEAFRAAGGVLWLRRLIDAEIARQLLSPTPTAHNPFPAGPDRFTQNQCRITFPPSQQD